MTIAEALPQRSVSGQVQESVPMRKRGRVRVFGKWCKGCGLCIAFCPRQVFQADDDHRPVVAQPDACVACGWCVTHCPDFAISLKTLGPNDDAGEVAK